MTNNYKILYLKKGLTALREKRYFDAHEEWEIAWKEMQGNQKLFWQAMIQLSVGSYHYTKKNLTGCRNLWNKAVSKCNRILDQGSGKHLIFVQELKDILIDCLGSVENNLNPLSIVEHAANHIISEKWFELE